MVEREFVLKHWESDFFAFMDDVFYPYLTNKTPEFHKEIVGLLLNYLRVVMAAPRGFAKSMLCSVFYPMWSTLFRKKKDVLIISDSEDVAIKWLRIIRTELEQNSVLITAFGNMRSDKWTERHLILNNGANLRARGAEAQIRGFRPDLIILDDIESEESVASEDRRNKLRDWIYKACINALTPDGQFIWIGTIINLLSLLNEVLEKPEDEGGWTKRRFQAYDNAIQEEGKEIWADRWSHRRLQQRKKEIGSFAFSSEFLNDPVSNEAAPVKPHQIRYWDILPKQYSCVISVDPAYSDDEKADYKVATVVGIDQNQNRYLITYIRTHKPTGEFIDAILNLYIQYKGTLTGVGIPVGGTEREFYNSVLRKAEERKMYPPFVELKNVFKSSAGTARSKKDRIVASLQPLFEAGKYYIHKNHVDAKDELLTIGASRWDDVVDSLAYAEQILMPVYYDVGAEKKHGYEEEKIDRGDTGYGI